MNITGRKEKTMPKYKFDIELNVLFTTEMTISADNEEHANEIIDEMQSLIDDNLDSYDFNFIIDDGYEVTDLEVVVSNFEEVS